MKTIILNASPRKKGNISSMISIITDEIKDKSSYEIIDVNRLSVKPCTGCMKCRSSNACILPQDDGHLVGEKMSKADTIIIASPVYWGNMPGTLKILFDRNVYRFMGESPKGIPVPKMKGKTGYIVTACTTPFPINVIFKQSSGLINAVNEIFKYSGIKLKRKTALGGTKKRDFIPSGMIKKLQKTGRSL
jgi:putative NADPH-quinone reductase